MAARSILLAEENRQLAATLVERLSAAGFDVRHVTDGVTALREIVTTPPDLLLLELKLPGLHGIELVRKLAQSPRTSNLPVIVTTGVYRGEKFRSAAMALGVRHYLEKPYRITDLLAAMRRELALPAPAGDEARPFAQHLRTAFLKRFSGQLTLQYPDTVRQLTFINGAPVALRPGFKSRDFGDFLFANGRITADEYTFFTTTAAYRHDSLVQIGCLHYSELLQAEVDYLEQELVCAFGGGPSRASWKAMPAPELLQLITLNVPQLFYDGFHRHPDTGSVQLLRTFGDKYVRLDEGYYRHINFLSLSDEEKRFIGAIDGRRRLSDLAKDGFDCVPLLLTLTNLNMASFAPGPAPSSAPADLPLRTLFNTPEEDVPEVVEETLESFSDLVEETPGETFVAPQAPVHDGGPTTAQVGGADAGIAEEARLLARSLEGKSHYEVFGIKPAKFSISLLKERYFAITRKFGPEVLMHLGGAEAVLVEEILSKVATAYDTLSDVVKKERYDEMLGADKVGLGHQGDDHFQAQVQAESGKVFLAMEDWDSAEKALQDAVNAEPNNGDFLASLAWAIYRNPKYADSQAMLNKARQMVNRAISMERSAQAFAYKGWMLLEGNQASMAEAEFNKALKLDARNGMARKGLRTLLEQQEQQKKGLFKRMFK